MIMAAANSRNGTSEDCRSSAYLQGFGAARDRESGRVCHMDCRCSFRSTVVSQRSNGEVRGGVSFPIDLLTLHHVNDESRQRLREEVCRLMGHTFTGCRNGLYFIDFCRIE